MTAVCGILFLTISERFFLYPWGGLTIFGFIVIFSTKKSKPYRTWSCTILPYSLFLSPNPESPKTPQNPKNSPNPQK